MSQAAKTRTVRAMGGVSIARRGEKFYIRFRDTDGIRRMRFAGTTLVEARAAAKAETADIGRKADAKRTGKVLGVAPLRFEEFVKEYRPVLATTMRTATLRVDARAEGVVPRR